MNDKARIQLGEGLRAFLDADDASASPQERAALQTGMCSPLEWLLQSLMDGQDGWDSRYSWIDGILPDAIVQTSPGALTINGLAIVVHGRNKWRLRPMQANLACPPALSSIRFASPRTEFNYPASSRHRYDVPTSWPYVFDVNLGRESQ